MKKVPHVTLHFHPCCHNPIFDHFILTIIIILFIEKDKKMMKKNKINEE
jgi:hypothetical protein